MLECLVITYSPDETISFGPPQTTGSEGLPKGNPKYAYLNGYKIKINHPLSLEICRAYRRAVVFENGDREDG